jgi:hypothetical protein
MVPYKLRHQNGCPGLFLRPPLFVVDIMCGVLTTAEIADRLSDGAAAVLADNDSGRGELRMADIMIAALDGSSPFDAASLAQAARTTWPDASWPGSPELARLKVESGGRTLFVDVLPPGGGLGIEGDDELAAEFVAWITRQVPIADSQIVVTDWNEDVVTLRPNMTCDEVYALRA